MEVRKELGYNDSDFVYGFVGRITKDNLAELAGQLKVTSFHGKRIV